MCNERKGKNNSVVVWYFYVFACGSMLLFIKNDFMVKHARNVTIMDCFCNGVFVLHSVVVCLHEDSWSLLPIAKKQMG